MNQQTDPSSCRLDKPHLAIGKSIRLTTYHGQHPAALPVYPARDDGLLAYHALSAFTSAYVELYYQGAEDVVADTELHAMVRWIGDPDGGNLPRLAGGIRLASPADVYQRPATAFSRRY